MADAYTGTAALSNLVQTAIDMEVRAALRHEPMLRLIADTRPAQVDKPGSSVTLYKSGQLAEAITPLNELSDPDAVALPNPTPVTVPLNEYGNVSITSLRVKNFSFSAIDPTQTRLISDNMRDSLDTLVQNVLLGGTSVSYGGSQTSTATVTATDILTSRDVRKAVTKLRGNAAQPRVNDLYWCGIHPDVAADLRSETGVNGWREAHIYAAPDLIWPAVTGIYEGAYFVESARMKKANDGATSATVYRTLFAGREALAEAVQIEPHVEIGTVPDKLNRFFPVGWYGLLGWNIFRDEALHRVETGSSFSV